MNSAPAWRTCSGPRTRATAYGSATISSSSRSSWLATDWSAPRCTSGANALKMPILTWRPWNPTGLVRRVAVDRGADDRAVDEPHVDLRQAGLPGDRALGLVERLALDGVDELHELGVADRLLGLLALLGERRREALDELAGDADDDLGRPEAGHLLGLLERDRAVVDDRGDVGDRARLHVAQALALAADAPDRPVAVLVDLEHERLGELGADVERRAGGGRRRRRPGSRCGAGTPFSPPRPSGRRRRSRGRGAGGGRGPHGRDRVPEPLATRALPLGHLRAARRPGRRCCARPRDERARRDATRRRGRR